MHRIGMLHGRLLVSTSHVADSAAPDIDAERPTFVISSQYRRLPLPALPL